MLRRLAKKDKRLKSKKVKTCPSCGEAGLVKDEEGSILCKFCGHVAQVAERAKIQADDPDAAVARDTRKGFAIRTKQEKITASQYIAKKLGARKVTAETEKRIIRLPEENDEEEDGRFVSQVVRDVQRALRDAERGRKSKIREKTGEVGEADVEEGKEELVEGEEEEEEEEEEEDEEGMQEEVRAKRKRKLEKKAAKKQRILEKRLFPKASTVGRVQVEGGAVSAFLVDRVAIPVNKTNYAGKSPFLHQRKRTGHGTIKLAFAMYFHELLLSFLKLFDLQQKGKFYASAYEMYNFYMEEAGVDFFPNAAFGPSENRFNFSIKSTLKAKSVSEIETLRRCNPCVETLLCLLILASERTEEPVYTMEICRAVNAGLLPAAQLYSSRMHPEIAKRLCDNGLAIFRAMKTKRWDLLEGRVDALCWYIRVPRLIKIPRMGTLCQRYLRTLDLVPIREVVPNLLGIFVYLSRSVEKLEDFFGSKRWRERIDGKQCGFYPPINALACIFMATASIDQDHLFARRLDWKGERTSLGIKPTPVTSEELQRMLAPQNKTRLSDHLRGFLSTFQKPLFDNSLHQPFDAELQSIRNNSGEKEERDNEEVEEGQAQGLAVLENSARKRKREVKSFPPWHGPRRKVVELLVEPQGRRRQARYRESERTVLLNKLKQTIRRMKRNPEFPWELAEKDLYVEESRLDWLDQVAQQESEYSADDKAISDVQVKLLGPYDADAERRRLEAREEKERRREERRLRELERLKDREVVSAEYMIEHIERQEKLGSLQLGMKNEHADGDEHVVKRKRSVASDEASVEESSLENERVYESDSSLSDVQISKEDPEDDLDFEDKAQCENIRLEMKNQGLGGAFAVGETPEKRKLDMDRYWRERKLAALYRRTVHCDKPNVYKVLCQSFSIRPQVRSNLEEREDPLQDVYDDVYELFLPDKAKTTWEQIDDTIMEGQALDEFVFRTVSASLHKAARRVLFVVGEVKKRKNLFNYVFENGTQNGEQLTPRQWDAELEGPEDRFLVALMKDIHEVFHLRRNVAGSFKWRPDLLFLNALEKLAKIIVEGGDIGYPKEKLKSFYIDFFSRKTDLEFPEIKREDQETQLRIIREQMDSFVYPAESKY